MKNASHVIIPIFRILMLIRIHDARKLPDARDAGGKVLLRTKVIYRLFFKCCSRIDRDIYFFLYVDILLTHCKSLL